MKVPLLHGKLLLAEEAYPLMAYGLWLMALVKKGTKET